MIDTGDLVKTDRRATFLGKEHEVVEVHLSDLVAWYLEGGVLRIYAEQHPEPTSFALTDRPTCFTYGLITSKIRPWCLTGATTASGSSPASRSGSCSMMKSESLMLWIHCCRSLRRFSTRGRVVASSMPSNSPKRSGSATRATTTFPQLEALGFTSRPDADGERVVFDPDDLTTPLGDLDAARYDDTDPTGSPRQT